MRWDIQPLVGLGPIKLGMKRTDVGRILDPIGTVTAFNTEADGSQREFRALTMPVISYRDQKVIGIDTSRRVSEVFFRDLDIYQVAPSDVLKELEKENGGAVDALGLIIFEDLGISCTGFFLSKERKFFQPGSGEQDDRGLGVFEKDSFSPYRSMFDHVSFIQP